MSLWTGLQRGRIAFKKVVIWPGYPASMFNRRLLLCFRPNLSGQALLGRNYIGYLVSRNYSFYVSTLELTHHNLLCFSVLSGFHSQRQRVKSDVSTITTITMTVCLLYMHGVRCAGSHMAYTNWADQRPYRYLDQCVKLDVTDGYKWSDAGCADRYPFFCEKGKSI